jgi:Tfp pilus assembly protein PilF
LKLSPDDAGVWNNYGVALDAVGRTNEAYAAFVRATQCQPPSRNAFLALIFLQIRAAHLDAADQILSQLEKQGGGPDAVVLDIRSVLARKRGNIQEADALEHQARTLDAGATAWAIERATNTGPALRSD